MTGLDPERDEIIEVASVVCRANNVVDERATVVKTTVVSGPSAQALHGISRDEQLCATPPVEALSAFLDHIEGCVLIGHGVEFDLLFLQRAISRWLPDREAPATAIDTLTLARRAIAAPRYTLEALCSLLALPPQRFHRATGDARATRALFSALCPVFAPASARDLWEVRVGQDHEVAVRSAIAAALAQRVTDGRPVRVWMRSGGRAPRQIRGVIEHWDAPHARVRRANAPPMIIRADRILRIELAGD